MLNKKKQGYKPLVSFECCADSVPNGTNLKKQKQINRLLARYLEQDEENDGPEPSANDDFYDDTEPDLRGWYNLEEKKRSVFRERGNDDGKPGTVQFEFN